MDLDDEAEDIEALAELERAEADSSDNDAAEEEEEVSKHRYLFTLTPRSVAFFLLYKLLVYNPIYYIIQLLL